MSERYAPTIATHVPVVVSLPEEKAEIASFRLDLPTPSLWQHGVKVVRKIDGKEAVVHRIDWSTNMFRAYYPGEDRFGERTQWEHCRDWNVAVTLSPQEQERQAARELLDAEIARLDAKSLAAVSVLCDDPDPAKALGKLEALRALGVVKVSSEAAQAAVSDVQGKAKR